MSLYSQASTRRHKGRGPKPRLWYKQIPLLDVSGRRTTLRLGPVSQSTAEEISRHVDNLVASKKYGTRLDESTKAWLITADSGLTDKLHRYGYCGPIQNPTIGDFLDRIIAAKKPVSAEATIIAYETSKKHLGKYFPNRRMADISSAEAKAFFNWLLTENGLGENTARRRFGRVREIFNDALEQGMIGSNPFKLRSISVTVQPAVKDYVPASTIDAVIKHLPADQVEWKLLFAFGRYIGCRMPSEIRNLRWSDVNWEHNTIRLISPKTKRKGKPDRLVPIFSEIQSLLLTQAEATDSEYVFPRLRNHSNAATTAAKMVEATGFTAWPKFWNALRASCETDLMDEYGLRKACQWIGNSPAIAMKNYSLLKKTDYIDAGKKSDAALDAARSSVTAHGREGDARKPRKPRKSKQKVDDTGLEPVTPAV